jgi:hypothetical protein
MKRYEYLNLSISKFLISKSEKHRKIIDDYAAKGYRFVGYIPTEITGHGQILSIDLVFESER